MIAIQKNSKENIYGYISNNPRVMLLELDDTSFGFKDNYGCFPLNWSDNFGTVIILKNKRIIKLCQKIDLHEIENVSINSVLIHEADSTIGFLKINLLDIESELVNKIIHLSISKNTPVYLEKLSDIILLGQ